MAITVAIDGPAAAGKGTIARAVAARFGLGYLDTGLLYRATGAKVAEGMDPVAAAESLTETDLARGDLRSSAAGQAASRVAAMADVRAALVAFQRDFARRDGGAVLDGRDIGTVICPAAEVKLFVTASDAVRAQRRWRELADPDLTIDAVLDDLRARDRRDSDRAAAPLRPAEGAVIIDTSEMDIDAAVAAAAAHVQAALAR
ncbi:(d)CMP kinase [Meridianimarinicoccus sp. RP-17]|uniref:(d)CMP kinase n=1 Tax=Meridianimarinicoccus zhengii TaxID=2056810 RepID=UPI000DAB4395|nr:(d)CMP kinase [Phycocomes zhengii]